MKLSLSLGILVVIVGVVSSMKESPEHGGKQGGDRIKADHVGEDGEHDAAYDHKSILGSEQNEKDFENLSPEESKKKLKVMLDIMDVDKDNLITNQELIVWIKRSYTLMDMDSTRSMIKEYDHDKDGQVTIEEYSLPPGDVEDHKPEINPSDQEKFAVADANNDGKLNVEEFSAFLYPYDYPQMQDVEVKSTLREMDSDKDGKLSLAEFIGMSDQLKKEDIEDYRKNFNKYDTNGDELMDAEEMIPWVMHDSTETASEEAKHLIDETDQNKDGKLTFDEILDKHELWVGNYAENKHTEL